MIPGFMQIKPIPPFDNPADSGYITQVKQMPDPNRRTRIQEIPMKQTAANTEPDPNRQMKLDGIPTKLTAAKHYCGSPHDRGFSDAWYGRLKNPHKMENYFRGARPVPLTDQSEIDEYMSGYAEGICYGGKDYGH